MKKYSFTLFITLFALMQFNAEAQFSGLKKKPTTAGGGADTTKPKSSAGGGGGVTTPTTPTPKTSGGNVTVRYDTIMPGGIDAKPAPSLRNNYAVERNLVKERRPLPYEDLREDDALWSTFIWREIDARQKMNMPFMYPGKEDNGDQRFFAILLSAIKNDSVMAFDPETDRFTKPLTPAQVSSITEGVNDTVEVTDPVSGQVENVITKRARFLPDSVYTFRLKEQWIFDKESSRMFIRIIGIAPIAKITPPGAKVSVARPLFWVYYPDLRPTLAKYEVYNPKNFSGRMSWEELFESRFFDSYITKTTLNNPSDRTLAALIKDPLFRLLEGENIKEKIFNFEQNLWSY